MIVLQNKWSNSEQHYIDSGINVIIGGSIFRNLKNMKPSVLIEAEFRSSNELWKSDTYRWDCSLLHLAYLQPVDQSDNRFILLY